VACDGELDTLTCPELDRVLGDALAGDCDEVVLDLRALRFLDSTGLRSILRARTRARAEGKRFELLRPSGSARRVFDVSGTT
jgi:anti-sigma B factor antagonist